MRSLAVGINGVQALGPRLTFGTVSLPIESTIAPATARVDDSPEGSLLEAGVDQSATVRH